jgi:hypothetical protein
VVFCGSEPRPPHPERPLFVSAGREDATKNYGATDIAFVLAALHEESARVLAQVGDATMSLLVDPERVDAPRGAYVLVLEADPGPHFAGDLVYVPEGAELPCAGLRRALLVRAEAPALPPPEVWERVPDPPFAPFEEGAPGELPIAIGDMLIHEHDRDTVRVELHGRSSSVPRHWLARFLFRVALHRYAIGYLETYGGFFYDDRDGTRRLGLHGVGSVTIDESVLGATFERLYRAVAPPGYVERIE